MLGNDIIKVKISTHVLSVILVGSIFLQVLEGYFYFSMGEMNCGTQLKLTAILTGIIFAILAFRFIGSNRRNNMKLLYLLGNYSFGIYFSHLAVMGVLNKLPYYSKIAIYPFNAILAVFLTFICVILGKKILGKNSKYLAL
jgi:peptidoglycan/LPS O-acetylase OafA/YrhL